MKKVLIVTYYWPPSGGPGVQRALKFAKYLPAYGWQPIVLTVKNGEYPQLDETLIYDIPVPCEVYRSFSLEPFRLYKKLTGRNKQDQLPTYVLNKHKNESPIERLARWIRLNVFIPDAKMGWIPFAVSAGLKLIKTKEIDLIFSTSPPHSVQLIAKKLAADSKLPWIADFRDPWLDIVYYQNLVRNPISTSIDRRLEQSVLKNATLVTAISNGMIDDLQQKAGKTNFRYIPNGFDPEDFANIKSTAHPVFTLTYSGFMSEDRIPHALLPALVKFKQDRLDFRLKLIGKMCDAFLQLLQQHQLMVNVELIPYLPHKKLLPVLAAADVLLLVIDRVRNNRSFMTGKIFDYLGCKKPILGIGPLAGDAAQVLSQTRSGYMLDYQDSQGVYDTLLSFYQDWQSGTTRLQFLADRYSRENQTRELAELMNQLSG